MLHPVFTSAPSEFIFIFGTIWLTWIQEYKSHKKNSAHWHQQHAMYFVLCRCIRVQVRDAKALCERQTQAVKLLSFVPLRIKETQPLAVEIDTWFSVRAMVH